MTEWEIFRTSLFLFWYFMFLEFCNQFPLTKRVHASVCCISLWFLQSVTSMFWFPFNYWLPLSVFNLVSIYSDWCPSGICCKHCVILINFFYDSFCKYCSSKVCQHISQGYLPGTRQEAKERSKTICLW